MLVKSSIVWDITPCRNVEISSETSVDFQQTTIYYIPKDTMLLSSCFQSKRLKIKTYGTTMLSVVLTVYNRRTQIDSVWGQSAEERIQERGSNRKPEKIQSSHFHNNVMNMIIDRQRLAKHVPELYAVNENKRPLLDNDFGICIAARTCIPVTKLAKHVGYGESYMLSRDNRRTNHWIECSVFGSRAVIKTTRHSF
jgi:hypothetical protein